MPVVCEFGAAVALTGIVEASAIVGFGVDAATDTERLIVLPGEWDVECASRRGERLR